MENELRQLKNQDRPEIIQAIATARDQGDLSENAEYHAAREKQSFIEGRILELEAKLSRAEIIHNAGSTHHSIMFGATVHLTDEDTKEKKVYTIVGEYETDIAKGLISTASPLGRALINKRVNDIIEVTTPNGDKGYEILRIEYQNIEIQ
jgi:transcription elongation factor GreA